MKTLFAVSLFTLLHRASSHLQYAALLPSDAERVGLWGPDSPGTVLHVWAARRGRELRGVAFAQTRKITWRRLWPLIQPTAPLPMLVDGAAARVHHGLGATSFAADSVDGAVGVSGWDLRLDVAHPKQENASDPTQLAVITVLPRLQPHQAPAAARALLLHAHHHFCSLKTRSYDAVVQTGFAELLLQAEPGLQSIRLLEHDMAHDEKRAQTQWQVVLGNVARLRRWAEGRREHALLVDTDEFIVVLDERRLRELLRASDALRVERIDVSCAGCSGPELDSVASAKTWLLLNSTTEPKVVMGSESEAVWAYPHWATGAKRSLVAPRDVAHLAHLRNMHAERSAARTAQPSAFNIVHTARISSDEPVHEVSFADIQATMAQWYTNKGLLFDASFDPSTAVVIESRVVSAEPADVARWYSLVAVDAGGNDIRSGFNYTASSRGSVRAVGFPLVLAGANLPFLPSKCSVDCTKVGLRLVPAFDAAPAYDCIMVTVELVATLKTTA